MIGLDFFVERLLKTPRGRAIVATVAVLLGGVFFWIAYGDARGLWRLQRERAIVDAEVVEARISHGMHFEKHHDVRYRFQVPGRSNWFTREERGTGRIDLWSSLDPAEWERARSTGRLQVVYVPNDPGVNLPLVAEANSREAMVYILAFASALIAGGLLYLLVVAARLWLRCVLPDTFGTTRSHPYRFVQIRG